MKRSGPTLVAALAIAVTMLTPRAARAHLLPANRATLNVVGDAVFAVASVPVSALHGFDDDGDGLLDGRELVAHGEALRAEIDRRFAIADGDAPGTTVTIDLVLSPEHEAAQDRAAHVVALKHVTFARAPRDLRLTCDLFGPGDPSASLTVTATRRSDGNPVSETATLTPGTPTHAFLVQPTGGAAPYGAAGVIALLLASPLVVVRRRARTPSGARRRPKEPANMGA